MNKNTSGWSLCPAHAVIKAILIAALSPSERESSGGSSAHFLLWARMAHGSSRSVFSFLKEPLCNKNQSLYSP